MFNWLYSFLLNSTFQLVWFLFLNFLKDSIFLLQGGLIGLLRGIEKFDSSKGCKISTYVYWWIRQVRLIVRKMNVNMFILHVKCYNIKSSLGGKKMIFTMFDGEWNFRVATSFSPSQGVSRTLAENSRMLRLPAHLHERLSSIHHAKVRLQEKGITPSIDVHYSHNKWLIPLFISFSFMILADCMFFIVC